MVQDDGIGFDVTAPRPRSFGLLGMRERVLALSGDFTVDSRPGAGTTIIAEIPLDEAGASLGSPGRSFA